MVIRTKLNLAAICVPGSVFYFTLSLSFSVGIFFVNASQACGAQMLTAGFFQKWPIALPASGFSWLAPMEKKRFAQYFMPHQQIGAAYHAFRALCLNFGNDCVPLYAAGNAGEIMAEALDGAQAIDQKTLTLLSAETAELPIRDAGRIPQVWILRHSRPLQKARCKMWVSHFSARSFTSFCRNKSSRRSPSGCTIIFSDTLPRTGQGRRFYQIAAPSPHKPLRTARCSPRRCCRAYPFWCDNMFWDHG